MGRGPPSHASEQMHPSHFQNHAIGTSHHFVSRRQFGRFSNRPFGVKHLQTGHHHCGVDVSHGLALLFGLGT